MMMPMFSKSHIHISVKFSFYLLNFLKNIYVKINTKANIIKTCSNMIQIDSVLSEIETINPATTPETKEIEKVAKISLLSILNSIIF